MSKRHKNILVWIISWAGLLLAVLYSPVGSPDMYSNKSFFAESQGVSFQEGRIENAPNVNLGSNGYDNELNVPDYSSSELKTANYPVGNYQSNSPSMGSSYSVQNQTYTRNTGSNGLTAGGSSIFIGS